MFAVPQSTLLAPNFLKLTNTFLGTEEENGVVLGIHFVTLPQGHTGLWAGCQPPAHHFSVKRTFQLGYLLERADFPAVRLDLGK